MTSKMKGERGAEDKLNPRSLERLEANSYGGLTDKNIAQCSKRKIGLGTHPE